MYKLTELQKEGKFKAKRDREVLRTVIGSKEHGGRVRGVPSKLTLKDGFQQDQASYRRHDCYKEEMKEAAEKALQDKFRDFFLAQMAEQQQSRLLWIAPSQEVGQQQMVMMPPPVLAHSTNIPGRLHNKNYSLLVALSDQNSWEDKRSCQGPGGSGWGFI